jgi:hypothetical protein
MLAVDKHNDYRQTLDRILAVDMASNQGLKLELIAKERFDVIQKLAQKSKKNPGFEDPTLEETGLLDRLDAFLTRLDNEVHMTPELKEKTKIHDGMTVIFDKPHLFKFPQKYVDRLELSTRNGKVRAGALQS